MKKLLAIAGVAAACAAFADETVEGTTEVGELEINSTATNCIVAVPFTELTGGNICVSNIVKTANLAVNDELYVYEGGWTAWVLKEGTGGAKYWQSVGTATIGKDGMPTVGTSPEPNAKTLVSGSAIWLKRQNPTGSFYVYGGYKQALSTPVTAGVYNLLANPLGEGKAIPGAATGDKLLVVLSSTQTKKYTYSAAKGGWICQAVEEGKVVYKQEDLKLPQGQGVWYMPKTSGTVTWRE